MFIFEHPMYRFSDYKTTKNPNKYALSNISKPIYKMKKNKRRTNIGCQFSNSEIFVQKYQFNKKI